jgi:hypothetical protein
MHKLCAGYKSLVGSNDQSLGWDIVNNKSLYNDRVINTYPENKPPGYQVGDRIVVILNLNEGTISFCDGDEKLGVCLTGLELFVLKNGQLCPAVSMTEPGAVVEIRDLTRRTGVPMLYLPVYTYLPNTCVDLLTVQFLPENIFYFLKASPRFDVSVSFVFILY